MILKGANKICQMSSISVLSVKRRISELMISNVKNAHKIVLNAIVLIIANFVNLDLINSMWVLKRIKLLYANISIAILIVSVN